MLGWEGARTLGHIAFVGIDPIGSSPGVEIGAPIDDFTAQFVKCRTLHLVTPLRQFGAVADDVELRIAQDIVAIIFEEIGHCLHSFHCFELQRLDKASG